MIKKKYIKPYHIYKDSFGLTMKILNNGYRPDYISGIWRGGIQIGINIQEMLNYVDIKTKNIFISSASYSDIEKQNKKIKVFGDNDIIKNLTKNDKILLVDDVYDTGLTMKKIIEMIYNKCKSKPEIKIATLFFKPKNNKTNIIPDFYMYETEKWLVFPHELVGLCLKEINSFKSFIKPIKDQIAYVKIKMLKNTLR